MAQKRLIRGGDPDERYPVPVDDAFQGDFLPAPELEEAPPCRRRRFKTSPRTPRAREQRRRVEVLWISPRAAERSRQLPLLAELVVEHPMLAHQRERHLPESFAHLPSVGLPPDVPPLRFHSTVTLASSSPASGREALDYYRTPAAAAERFLEAWAPTVPVPARLDELPDDLRIREYPV